ncbi:MAG: creatininase family protein [Candidatus Bathyarchaeota archaeon]|nr:creatininase family protein [Candidatus Bathyarchaeota archaeon]
MTHTKKPQLFWLDELSTKEAAQAAKNGTVIIFPLGSVEEHGDHLPLGTDCIQPEYIAAEVAKRTGCLVAPPFRYGICNATRNFPGTLTIQFDTLYRVAHDILSELIRNGFYRIIVMSGHAGNSHMVALRLAAQDIVTKNDELCAGKVRIMVLSDFDFAEELATELAVPDDGHAGTIETSRVMAIKPELVKGKGKAEKRQLPRFEVVAHPERCFPGGVNGDPTVASAEKGKKINEYVIGQVEKLVRQLQMG